MGSAVGVWHHNRKPPWLRTKRTYDTCKEVVGPDIIILLFAVALRLPPVVSLLHYRCDLSSSTIIQVDDVSHHVTLLQALVRPCAFRCPASVADCCFLPPLSPPLAAVIGRPVLWSQQGGVGNFPSPSQLSRSSSSTLRSLLELVAVTGYWLPPPSTSTVMMQCAPKMVVSNRSKDDGPEYILCKQGDAKMEVAYPHLSLLAPPSPYSFWLIVK